MSRRERNGKVSLKGWATAPLRWLQGRLERDNAQPVIAYRVEYGFSSAVMILLKGERHFHVKWLGSWTVRRWASDRIIAECWRHGLKIAPSDCRTREISLAEVR